MTVPLVLISGPVGVGKSSAAQEVSLLLEADGVPHTVIDFDALRGTFPRPDDDPWCNRLALDILAAAWRRCREAGSLNLVAATVVEQRGFVDDLTSAVPDAVVTTFQLRASERTLRSRLEQREQGSGLAWHLARSGELARALEDERTPCDHRIETEDRSLREVAADIYSRVTWRRG